MLQFITVQSDRRTISEQATMAIEGGCKWIELRVEGVDAEARRLTLRQAALEVEPLCREAGVYLLIHGEVGLAAEIECHGVVIDPSETSPSAAREELGAGAIIGVRVLNVEHALKFRSVDIDYLSVPTSDTEVISQFAKAVSTAGWEIPIVASGDKVGADNALALMEAGARGVAVSQEAVSASDMVLYIAGILKIIE